MHLRVAVRRAFGCPVSFVDEDVTGAEVRKNDILAFDQNVAWFDVFVAYSFVVDLCECV